MWMNRDNPELEDICNAFKEVFEGYGIRAQRADDIEHQQVITEVVLRFIQSADFIVADLTGQRPNVYYEIGFSHALGRRPLLFRKAGTPIHFDLAGHNVREYKNVTHLKMILRRALSTFVDADRVRVLT